MVAMATSNVTSATDHGTAGGRVAAVLEALDDDQREVALALRGPVCVLAGAGTGKTRAITHRIAHGVLTGVYSPTSVLALTFTARAAGEMRSRLRALGVGGVQARTFHAAALRQLQYFYPQAVGGGVPRIIEHKVPIVAEAAGRLRLDVDRTALRDLAAEIEWAKVGMITPEEYVARAAATARPGVAGFDHDTVARVMSGYEELKTDRYVIDFEDVLLFLVGWLDSRPDVADQVRNQYRHFVVDEYQDVSPLQQRLLDLWLGGRDELCVVGDANQTIYSFTGATPDFLLDFPRRFPEAQVVRLVRDYRSTPQVVAAANRVISRARGIRRAKLELIAQRPDGPPVRFATYDDDVAEAHAVAQRIKHLISTGVSASEVAVLYRTNAQSEPFEAALSEAGIGYVLRGAERFFNRREVREAILLLRGAARATPADMPLGQAVRDVLAGSGWSEEPPAATGAVRERWESLRALVALADEVAQVPGAAMANFITELDERAAAQHAPTINGVTLASLHAAKGLEWDAVFLIGMSEGLMPISLAEGDAAVEEERRLLYVGITRAREHLELSWARARTPGARASRRCSRFVEPLWPSAPTPADEVDVDQEVFARLKQWRLELATETGKPAFTVFPDTTLRAIATALPENVAELARLRGVGPVKIQLYAEQVLAIVRGEN